MALEQLFNLNTVGAPVPVTQPAQSGAQTVMRSLDAFTGSSSPYIENARRRGLELAATRGGINSSIAAGAAERSALEAAQPLVQQAVQIDQNNQQLGQQAQYDNWLSQQNFGRALFGQQFTSSLGMLEGLQQAALQDPELYSPETVSGFSNFFNTQMSETLKRYFGG